MKPLYAFIHIPRTGGTSFIDIAKKNLGKDKVSKFPFNAPQDLDKIEFIHGHFRYSMVESCGLFDTRDIIYITILRHPVERVISYYYHSNTDEAINKWLENKTPAVVEYNQHGEPVYDRKAYPLHMVENTMCYYLDKEARCWIPPKLHVFFTNTLQGNIKDHFLSWIQTKTHLNATPKSKKQYIPFETRMKIAELNQDDLKLYSQARREFG